MSFVRPHEPGAGQARSGLLLSSADRSRAAGPDTRADLGLYRHLPNKTTAVDQEKTRPSTSTQNGPLTKIPKGKGSPKALLEAPSGRPYTSWKLVSQRRQALDSGGASMREPSLPPPYLPSRTNTQGSQAAPSAPSSRPEPQKPAQAAVLSPPDRHSDRRSPTLNSETPGARGLWKQIKPHLDRLPLSIRHDSTGGFLGKLLELPTLRHLEMEREATDTFKATTEFDIPSLALYLTGLEASYPCFRCLCRKGPFKGCIVVHPDAPSDVRNGIKCCANCYYKGHGDSCGVDASLTHSQQEPDTAASAQGLAAPQTSSEPPILEEAIDSQHHERPTQSLPEKTPTLEDPDRQAKPEAESFSEIAVACFAAQLKNDGNGKGALPSVADVTPVESSSSTNSSAAQSSQSHVNEAIPKQSTGAPEAEREKTPPITPTRRSIRLVQKSSTRASSATPGPKTPGGRKQLSIRIPETPPSRSAQQHHDRVQEQDPDLSPVSTTRRSERLRTRTPATPSKPGGLRFPTALTGTQSSTNKRKLEEVESAETTSGGAAAHRVRFKRREIHLGSQSSRFSQPSPFGSSVSSAIAPTPPVSAVSIQSSRISAPSSSASSAVAPLTPVSAAGPQHRCRDPLELEDWEIAPGRVRSEKDNIAFSTAYLRATKPLPVHPGVGFHVVTLHPGKSFRLKAQADRVRVVSIARGKARVRFPGMEEFALDADGVVKVPPDTACVLENRLAADATLHVCCLHQPQQA
ncbi:hypothetical protein DL769_002865 [Monosporascus sp. CRB-8-3]|nr:hypothetical protein DL769_002865 [Monosporascus sp. CRB-8-3]